MNGNESSPAKTKKAKPTSSEKKEIAVPLFSEVTPWFCNCTAVLDDAVDKQEAATCSQPGKQDNENENEPNQNANAYHENRVRNLADRLIQLLHIFAAVVPIVESAAATQVR